MTERMARNKKVSAIIESGLKTKSGEKDLFDLPPLGLYGSSNAVEHMTQTELRSLIPVMIRYSTGRGKPGWGNPDLMPTWWPKGVPWENVKSDTRSDAEKKKFPWTDALRQVVINCYQHHGREDLLPPPTQATVRPAEKSKFTDESGKKVKSKKLKKSSEDD